MSRLRQIFFKKCTIKTLIPQKIKSCNFLIGESLIFLLFKDNRIDCLFDKITILNIFSKIAFLTVEKFTFAYCYTCFPDCTVHGIHCTLYIQFR